MVIFPVVKGNACCDEKNRVIATINKTGKVEIVSFKEKKNFFGINLLFFRGIAMLIFGIYVFLISLNRSQMILGAEKVSIEEKIASKIKISSGVVSVTICGILGAIIGIVGIVLIPYLIFGNLVDGGISVGLASFIIAIIRVALLALIMLCLRAIPIMRQFYRHNSAGNLALAEYQDKRVDSYYLSTNFLNFVICGLLLSIFVLSFIVVDLNFFLKVLINVAVTLGCFSLMYEFLHLFEFKNNLFAKIMIIPVAYLTAEKPSKSEREIAFSALNEVILMRENEERLIGETKNLDTPFSVVYAEVKNRLAEVGIEDVAETEWLIAEVLEKNRTEIKLLTHIGREDYRKIKSALAKREKRMPISKIFNHTNFYGYDFYVDKNVLSPRQETEQVVEEVIKLIKQSKTKVKTLDLMTGSGAIAITIAKETGAEVWASDISNTALEIAKKNAKENKTKIKFVKSNIFQGFKKQKFDFIISNPPYIPSKDVLTLDDEVKKYDPLIALDGGEDGLYFYREIAKNSPSFLKKGGTIILEVGYNQGNDVKKLLQNAFENIRIKKDYSKNDRIVIATLK